MHILLIHQNLATMGEPGGTRHVELASRLARRGHRFTVLASSLNYLTGQRIVSRTQRFYSRNRLDGGVIWRLWAYPGMHKAFFSRALGFACFAVLSLIASLHVKEAHVVWGTSPPLPQSITAYLAARLKGIPFLFEVRDLWPDFAIQAGVLRNPILVWASRRLEHFLYTRADAIIVNSPGFVSHLTASGTPKEKITVVPNGVDVSRFDPDDRGERVREELSLDSKFVVLYTGAHGMANDLKTLLEAVALLEYNKDICFVLVGDGKERAALIREAKGKALGNVHFVVAQPKHRMPEFLAAADVCIATLLPIPLFATTYPNKVFDYMAAGRPTILAIDGVVRELIEEAQGGCFARPGDPTAIADAILSYYRDPELARTHGANARMYVADHFDRSIQAHQLERVLRELSSIA